MLGSHLRSPELLSFVIENLVSGKIDTEAKEVLIGSLADAIRNGEADIVVANKIRELLIKRSYFLVVAADVIGDLNEAVKGRLAGRWSG